MKSEIIFIFTPFKNEQINQQNMTQESVSFAEVATYVREKLSSFFLRPKFLFCACRE